MPPRKSVVSLLLILSIVCLAISRVISIFREENINVVSCLQRRGRAECPWLPRSQSSLEVHIHFSRACDVMTSAFAFFVAQPQSVATCAAVFRELLFHLLSCFVVAKPQQQRKFFRVLASRNRLPFLPLHGELAIRIELSSASSQSLS